MRALRAPIIACAVALIATVLPAAANDRPAAPVLLPESLRAAAARMHDSHEGAFALDCAACGHGDSGTGVFNARDELVGIVTAGYSADATRILVLSERYPG